MSVDLLRWAERFIATPSPSRAGNAAIAALAAELLAEIGLDPQTEAVEIDGITHHAVHATLGSPGEEPGGVLLVTHLDTVPPGSLEAWTATGGDPYRPTRVGERLYGLGSADAKLDFVCKVAALRELSPGTRGRPVRIVGSFGEEIGLLGARWLVEAGLARGLRWALVGEPSELRAVRAHKGYAVFEARIPLEPRPRGGLGRAERLELEGNPVHSSAPELGVNAIELALTRLAGPDVRSLVGIEGGGAVNQVPGSCTLWVEREGVSGGPTEARREGYTAEPLIAFHRAWRELLAGLAKPRDPEFDPDHSVGSLGWIALQDREVTLRFDLRPIPGVDPERAVEPLAKVAELRCLRRNPPLATPPSSPLVQAVSFAQRSVGLPESVTTKATCTEAGLLAESGLVALVIGPGRSVGNVHRPNEYTRIPELSLARDLYRHALRELVGDGGS
ncbi:MAG: M20/M25/M40 family metallo-hydrolase [Myxococcota bacterium]